MLSKTMTESTSESMTGPFATFAQASEATILGMWVFLISEVLFFGALFFAFITCHTLYPAAFEEASRHLSVSLGTLNTAVLLTSSFTMALALKAAGQNQKNLLVTLLLLSVFLALAFLGIKALEYSREFQEHLFPNRNFLFGGAAVDKARLFFCFYFIMTALHALHILIGIGLILYVSFRAFRGRYNAANHLGIELVALYWHFVDVIWIFLFPMLYLWGHAR